MNEVISVFSSKRYVLLEMNLRQLTAQLTGKLGFTYSACGKFTKNNERIQKLKEVGDTRYTYQNDLDKVCFQHDAV